MRDESQLCERAMEVRPWQRGKAMVTVASFSAGARVREEGQRAPMPCSASSELTLE